MLFWQAKLHIIQLKSNQFIENQQKISFELVFRFLRGFFFASSFCFAQADRMKSWSLKCWKSALISVSSTAETWKIFIDLLHHVFFAEIKNSFFS